MRTFDIVVSVLQSAFTAPVVLAMVWVVIRRNQIPGTPMPSPGPTT